jgi:hypothetical protein
MAEKRRFLMSANKPWLAIASTLLAGAKEAAGRTRRNMTSRTTSHDGEKENHALAKCVAAANRGWMSEKYLSPAGQEKCFFLTSPFIEPAGVCVQSHCLVTVRTDNPQIMSTFFPKSEYVRFLDCARSYYCFVRRLICLDLALGAC